MTLPHLPKAEGIDFQYRMKLIILANGFSKKYHKLHFWQREKKEMCLQAIINIMHALN